MPPVYRKSKAAMMSTPSPGLSLAAGDLSAANHMPSTSASVHTASNYCTLFWPWLMSDGGHPAGKSGKSLNLKVLMKSEGNCVVACLCIM